MEPTKFDYSLKNIPIPSNNYYLKCLIDKVDSFLRKVRWKANFYDKNQTEESKNDEIINTNSKFGLKSNKSPKQNVNLIPFENDICDMIKNIEFRKSYTSQFKKKS